MSVQAIAWALKQPVKPAAAKLLLIAIANYADESGRAWPSKSRLARDCSTDRRVICRHLSMLEDARLCAVQERWDGPVQLTSLITLILDGEPCRRGRDSGVTGGSDPRVTTPVTQESPKPSVEPSKIIASQEGTPSEAGGYAHARTHARTHVRGLAVDEVGP